MTLPSVLVAFLDRETLTVAGLVVALAVALFTIVKYRAETQKLRAETRKIKADTVAAERATPKSERERIQDCARNILQSVSATADEVFATFYPFADPPQEVSREKLQEVIRVARRFRHEQRYRAEIEPLISELTALARGVRDEALARLHALMLGLLAKIGEKKVHVANIEAAGLTPENAMAVAAWLDEIRESQIGIASLIREISARLSLAGGSEDGAERAA